MNQYIFVYSYSSSLLIIYTVVSLTLSIMEKLNIFTSLAVIVEVFSMSKSHKSQQPVLRPNLPIVY